MKKVLSFVVSASVMFAGLLGASPANAVGTANPTFATTSYEATEGVAFSAHLNPTFNASAGFQPTWLYGSKATLNTVDCQALPSGLTFVEDNFVAGAGVEPTYNISGTPAAGSAGTYNICFDTQSDEEGWVSVGTSDVVTITVGTTPPTPVEADYTIDCQTGVSSNVDVNLDGLQTYTKTVRIKGCGYYFVQDTNGTLNDYVGTSTDVVYTVTIPIDWSATASGYNTWDVPNSITQNIFFYNWAPAPPPGPGNNTENADCTGEGDTLNVSNTNASLSGLCTLSGAISDAGTSNTSDAFDTFGAIKGMNIDETSFDIRASTVITNDGGNQKYIASNIYSAQDSGYVDVVVERKFIGNTITWNVNVYETGTETPANFTFYLSGNLGSDSSTTWGTSNGKVVSNDGFKGDPALIWNTDGNMVNSEGSDDVSVNWQNVSSGSLSVTLLGYYNCATAEQINAGVDAVTADYANKVSTDLTDIQGSGCVVPADISANETSVSENGSVTISVTNAIEGSGVATFVDGVLYDAFASPMADFSGTFNWEDLEVDLSENHVVTWRYYSTSGAGELTWDTAYDDAVSVNWVGTAESFTTDESVTFVQGVEETNTFTLTPNVVHNWANGGNITFEGVPAGLTATVVNGSTANVIPSFTLSGTTNVTAGNYTITVTLTDDFGHSSSQNVTVVVEEAPVVPPVVIEYNLVLDAVVGDQSEGASTSYSAEGLKEGTEWTLTLRSTPQVIASGIVTASGIITGTALIPAGLEAGWHSVTLTGTDINGEPIESVVWFKTDADGLITEKSATEPTDTTDGELAYTGTNSESLTGAFGGAAAAVLGGLVLLVARRRKTGENA